MRARALLALWIAGATVACGELHPLQEGVCGNFVVDSGEDCDSLATAPGAVCAPPGAAAQCRFACAQGAICPPGYGCGADLVCRAPTGPLTFTPLGPSLDLAYIQDVRTGDFDGDSHPDILALGEANADGRRGGRILFSAPDGSPTDALPLPALVGAADLSDVDADSATELVFGDFGGVSVFKGSSMRGAELVAYPFFTVPVQTRLRGIPIEALPNRPGQELLAMVQPAGGKVTLQVPSEQRLLTTLPGDEDALSGPILVAKFDEALPCSQVVFPYRAPAAQVVVVSPCLASGSSYTWNDKNPPTVVTLPDGYAFDSGALAADLDGDGHQDLLLGTDQGVIATWGNGDGTFRSMKVGGELNKAGTFAIPDVVSKLGLMPLALSDINLDGQIDYVMPGGVALSGPAPGDYVVAYQSEGAVWTSAVVAEFHDGGFPDVVAASDGLDLDFLNNAGGGSFNHAFILTTAVPGNLVAGDFDGDLVTDLAFSEKIFEDGTGLDHIAIAFGQAHGPPGETQLITRLGAVKQVALARFADQAGFPGGMDLNVVDGIDDLVAVSHDDKGQNDSLFTLRGSGNRVMTAPLPLQAGQKLARPLALADGTFGDTPDLVALGVVPGNKLYLWRVASTAEVELSHIQPSDAVDGTFFPIVKGEDNGFRFGALLGAADFGGDGVSEAVAVASLGGGNAGMVIADYHADSFKFVPRAVQQISATLSEDSVLLLRDIDHDGHPDALLVDGSDDKPGNLIVFWGQQGGLAAAPTTVSVPGGVTGIACVQSDPRAPCELVLLGSDHVYLTTVSKDRQVSMSPISALPGGTDIEAADFDRDGVTDLVIGDQQGLQVFHGEPKIR